jgi:peptidoglycan/LPS O-acetylase OafA/YrhL
MASRGSDGLYDQFSAWLTAIFLAELMVGCFLVFGKSGVAWYKRIIAAFFGLGCLILFVVVVVTTLSGQEHFDFDLKTLAVIFVLANLMAIRLFLYVRENPPSCLGTMGKMLGCLAVGILAICAVVYGIAMMIGLGGYFGK